MAKIYHFSGAGNDFVVLDGRREDLSAYRQPATIRRLCDEYGTDGLMILSLRDNDLKARVAIGEGGGSGCNLKAKGSVVTGAGSGSNDIGHEAPADSAAVDFTMEFYNPDGSSGMMCGNGGRCIAAFADYLGISAAAARGEASSEGAAQAEGGVAALKRYLFRAPDGVHSAEILERAAESQPNRKQGGRWQVRLGMRDVEGVKRVLDGYFLDTGTRHFVKFVPDVEAIDIDAEALPIRHDPLFAPEGTNVNFVQLVPGGIKVRTFEKGVEGETLACGTGITASAIAAVFSGRLTGRAAVGALTGGAAADAQTCKAATGAQASQPAGTGEAPGDAQPEAGGSARSAADGIGASHKVAVQARRDTLEVDFAADGARFTRVFLTGPAEML